MSRIFYILFITSLISCNNSSNQKNNNDLTISIDSLTNEFKEIYKQGYITGFSVAIVNKDTTVYQRGFGYSDIKTGLEYTSNTVQNVASISKTLIGIALLKAQELGKLELDDPVNMYLPFEVTNPNHPKNDITLRHLATHTSTIIDTKYYGAKAYVLKEDAELTKEIEDLYVKLNLPESHTSILDYLKKVLPKEGIWYDEKGFLKNKPGEIFEYSNIGATLAALALEKATGDSFDKFTGTHILEPLKMDSSGWSFNYIDMATHTKLYTKSKTEIPFYSLITYPDGGLITSARDLSKYLQELINGFIGEGTLLNKQSYKEFFTKQLEARNFTSPDNAGNEGLFLGFKPDGLVGHSGGDPGVSTYMFFDPEFSIGVIVLVNTELDSCGDKQYEDILSASYRYVNCIK